MQATVDADHEYGPVPLTPGPYRTICVTTQGRLSAFADPLGTLQLHLQAGQSGHRAGRLPIAWRSGPLRRCDAMLEALERGLSVLGRNSSRQEALRLGRRIDDGLHGRLANYLLVNDGRYEQLLPRVLLEDAAAARRMPPSGAWIVARETDQQGNPAGTCFLLVRRRRTWELWKRSEHATSRRAPARHHAWLCSVDLLQQEPHFAAELLLYAHRRGSSPATRLASCDVGLISAQRLAVLESALDAARRHG